MRSRWTVLLAILPACQSLGQPAPSRPVGDPGRPPSVLDTPVEFAGWRGAPRDPHRLGEIRVGLFVPQAADHPVGTAVTSGAALAIERVNATGGFEGVPLRLIHRWDDDPWRGGAKAMTALVYRDSVWAVIGSATGDATHVAEQVVTKAWVPLLAPVSADPTLTQIRIPWMFRLPPDDRRQAQTLVSDGIRARGLERVGLITTTDHDGRTFAGEMLALLGAELLSPVFHFQVSPSVADVAAIVARVRSFGPDGLIVRLPMVEVVALLDRLQRGGCDAPLLMPWVPGLQPADLRGRYRGDILYVLPFAESDHAGYAGFARAYAERYGRRPPPSAAYAYDAVLVLARSLRRSGLSHPGLRDAIAGSSGYTGVTGPILWDNAGGNRGTPVLVTLLGSVAVP